MKNIRKYAEQVGHQVVGKLTRRPEWEYQMDSFTGEKKHSGSATTPTKVETSTSLVRPASSL